MLKRNSVQFSRYRYSKATTYWAFWLLITWRLGRSRTSRLLWSKPLLTKRPSLLRTFDCWRRCGTDGGTWPISHELQSLDEVSQAVTQHSIWKSPVRLCRKGGAELSGTEEGDITAMSSCRRRFVCPVLTGMDHDLTDAVRQRGIRLNDPNVVSALAARAGIHSRLEGGTCFEANNFILRAGFRTLLVAPLLRGELCPHAGRSAPHAWRRSPRTDRSHEAFADQSAMAIENARLFDEIEDKSRQLEEASQHKSQFLANRSHELRTPLNAILGYTELMADGAYGQPSEKMLGILKRLEANGKHLLGLINDALDLSKIEAGQLVLELSDYSVQDIAQTVRSTLEPLAADKKLAFKVAIAPELPPGHGDGRRLTQVRSISSATPLSSPMPAKSPSRPQRMAHSMYRSVTRAPASPLPIRPSCFRSSSRPTMPSPRRRVVPAWDSPYRSASSRCTAGRSASSYNPAKARRLRSAPGHRRAAGGASMSKRILVVEDQPDSRQIIHDMLAPTDFEITAAENGEQALAAIAKQRPDLILMEIQLPIMDGYAATRRIKTDPA